MKTPLDSEKVKSDLHQLYEQWSNELQQYCSDLLVGNFSHPHYIGAPDGWDKAEKRIMIVGEEGHGEWGYGKAYGWKEGEPSWTIKDIGLIQNYTVESPNDYVVTSLRKPFWRRYRKVVDLGYPCIWNNLDKIFSLVKRKITRNKTQQLTTDEETLLHSTPTKVLQREIEILRPTHVVFFGWYYNPLSVELPQVYNALLAAEKQSKDLLYSFEIDKTTYVFTYHPNWRKKPKGYEQKAADYIANIVNSQQT